jgi:transcriptional regulator with XRE-family HTH domain
VRKLFYCHRHGLSQSELGATLGLSYQQLQKYESGANKLGVDRAIQIGEVLGISVFGLDGAATEPLPPSDKIDLKIMVEFSQLDPEIKPDALEIVRRMNKHIRKTQNQIQEVKITGGAITMNIGSIAYIDQDAPGAIPRGTPIVKIVSEAGDANPIGTNGKVLGSLSDDDRIGYFIEWETMPGMPVFVSDFKVGRQQ